MKKVTYAITAVLLIALGACRSTTSLQVMRPADIALPDHIQRFLLADRTRPEEAQKEINIIEGILTGEGIGIDKDGAIACLEGVKATLLQTPRFTVDITSVTGLKGTGTARMPAPLPWDTITKLCNARQADAMVVLESFDSNNQVFTESVPVQGGAPQLRTRTRVTLITGWRVYDAKNKRILDEHVQTSEYIYDGQIGGLLDIAIQRQRRKEMMRAAGDRAGDMYGHRISPQWIWVNRNYYNKGNDQLKIAARFARTQNWDKAAEIWQKQTTNAKEKVAARATYNMALAAEKAGDLDLAITWIEKAYTQYGMKKALPYRNELYFRKAEQERLKEQMKSLEKKN